MTLEEIENKITLEELHPEIMKRLVGAGVEELLAVQ